MKGSNLVVFLIELITRLPELKMIRAHYTLYVLLVNRWKHCFKANKQ